MPKGKSVYNASHQRIKGKNNRHQTPRLPLIPEKQSAHPAVFFAPERTKPEDIQIQLAFLAMLGVSAR